MRRHRLLLVALSQLGLRTRSSHSRKPHGARRAWTPNVSHTLPPTPSRTGSISWNSRAGSTARQKLSNELWGCQTPHRRSGNPAKSPKRVLAIYMRRIYLPRCGPHVPAGLAQTPTAQLHCSLLDVPDRACAGVARRQRSRNLGSRARLSRSGAWMSIVAVDTPGPGTAYAGLDPGSRVHGSDARRA